MQPLTLPSLTLPSLTSPSLTSPSLTFPRRRGLVISPVPALFRRILSFMILSFMALSFMTLPQTAAARTAGRPDLSTAQALFQNGNFTGAIKIAEKLDTPGGYNLAIQALLVRATFKSSPSGREALIRKAHGLSQKTYELFPDDTTTLLNMVVTTGLLSRLDEADKADQVQSALNSRRLLDKARQQDPLNPMVYATQAGWHSEVVHQAGSLAVLLGASRDKALALYLRALMLGPQDLIIRLEYVKFSLRGLPADALPEDSTPLLRDAAHHLRLILDSPSRMALDTFIQGQARDLLGTVRNALKNGDATPVRALLKRLDLIPERD